MDIYGEKVNRLIGELGRLPGIGGKTAQRLAFHIINMPEEQVESLSEAIMDAKKHIRYCKSCCTITDQELCPVCDFDSFYNGMTGYVDDGDDEK